MPASCAVTAITLIRRSGPLGAQAAIASRLIAAISRPAASHAGGRPPANSLAFRTPALRRRSARRRSPRSQAALRGNRGGSRAATFPQIFCLVTKPRTAMFWPTTIEAPLRRKAPLLRPSAERQMGARLRGGNDARRGVGPISSRPCEPSLDRSVPTAIRLPARDAGARVSSINAPISPASTKRRAQDRSSPISASIAPRRRCMSARSSRS